VCVCERERERERERAYIAIVVDVHAGKDVTQHVFCHTCQARHLVMLDVCVCVCVCLCVCVCVCVCVSVFASIFPSAHSLMTLDTTCMCMEL